jgi:hypothetical protein
MRDQKKGGILLMKENTAKENTVSFDDFFCVHSRRHFSWRIWRLKAKFFENQKSLKTASYNLDNVLIAIDVIISCSKIFNIFCACIAEAFFCGGYGGLK